MFRNILALLLSVSIAGLLLGGMFWRVWDDLIEALRYIEPVYLIPAVLICLLAWICRGWRYRAILSRLSVLIPVFYSTACIFLSQTVNLVVPARLGDLIRIVLIRHEYQATISQGVSSIVVERIFDIITVAMLGLISVLFVLSMPDWMIPLLVVPLVLGGLFFLFLVFIGRFTTENRYLGMILRMLEEIRSASLTPVSAAVLFLSSVGIWLLDTIICCAVGDMFGQAIPFAVVLLAVVAGNLVKAVPVTPGGIGTYEVTLAVIFEVSGVAPAVATLIAVMDHLIKNLITLVGGAISIPYFGNWVIPEIMASIRRRMNDEETGHP